MSDRAFCITCALAVGAFVVGFFSGCGASAGDVARAALSDVATIASHADAIEADAYAHAADACLSGTDNAEAYVACIAPHDVIVRAEIVLRDALLSAEAVADAVDAGREGSPYDGLACATVALEDLLRLLRNVDIPIPSEFEGGLRLLRSLALGPCYQ